MSDFTDKLCQEAKDIWSDVQQHFCGERDAQIQSACDDERSDNIALAGLAMIDAGLDDNTVEKMLQKYWDLRRSETIPFLEWAHKQLNQKL